MSATKPRYGVFYSRFTFALLLDHINIILERLIARASSLDQSTWNLPFQYFIHMIEQKRKSVSGVEVYLAIKQHSYQWLEWGEVQRRPGH